MFTNDSLFKAFAVALLAASLTGCGGSSPAGVDEEWEEEPTPYTSTPTTGFGNTPGTGGFGTNPTTGQYGAGTGIGAGPAVGGDLIASVIKKKNGFLFGMGKFTCTVEVTNPSSIQRTGTLTVTFKNGSKASKTAPITQSVSLGPNETKSFEFSDKAWSTDAVEAEVTTDASSGMGAPAGNFGGPSAGAGYGAPAPGFGGPMSAAY
jgi:hypothetical protein